MAHMNQTTKVTKRTCATTLNLHGGGADMADGEECGHDGAAFAGMEIDGSKFLSNGRRLKK